MLFSFFDYLQFLYFIPPENRTESKTCVYPTRPASTQVELQLGWKCTA